MIPGVVPGQLVVAENLDAGVVLDGLRVWPDEFEFRLMIFGVGVVFPSTPEELVRLRATGRLRERLDTVRPEPATPVDVAECAVVLPALASTTCQLRVCDMSTISERTRVRYLATPMPTAGDAVVRVGVAGLNGEVVLPGDDLRAAATRARPLGDRGRSGP